MDIKKNIALVAHDNRKKDLCEWAEFNWQTLIEHKLVCTGTTGRLIEETIEFKQKEVGSKKKREIIRLKSGPLGGDQQLGAMIAEGDIDILIFLWDPMASQPHDVDVKALLRIATVYNITTAIDRATADFIISSPLFQDKYQPILKDYSAYLKRDV